MSLPAIQHSSIYLSGFFVYDVSRLNSEAVFSTFAYDNYYKENEDYFRQKYYANWLSTLYPDKDKLDKMGLSSLEGNQLTAKNPDLIKAQKIVAGNKEIAFFISECKVFLFQENLGIFSIRLNLAGGHQNFEDISGFASVIRNTTSNTQFVNSNPLLHFIEENIIVKFCNDTTAWRNFNPQLKLFMNIDADKPFADQEQWNDLLFELATVSPIGTIASGGIFAPSRKYYESILENNVIDVFNNWKVLTLFDSTIRISINLKESDRYNLWENDYYTIYIFTLFIRFYLYQINARLASLSGNIKKGLLIRNNYVQFLNDFDLTQIAFKFLPDIIYRSLLRSMNVEEEMGKLEQKIGRINTSIRELQERKIELLLRILAVISLISVIDDGWDLAMRANGLDHLTPAYVSVFIKTTLFLVLLLLVTAAYVYRRRKING